MKNVTRFFFLGLFATLALQFSPALAFHEPGHIPPTGTCREPPCCIGAGCEKDDENKGKEPQKEKKNKCDPGSPSKWLEKYRAAQSKFKQSGALYDTAQEELRERINENLKELGIEVGVSGGIKVTEKMLEATGNETVIKITEAAASGVIIALEIALWVKALAEIGYQTHDVLVEAREMSEVAEKTAKEGLQLMDEAQSQIKEDLKNDRLCNDARRKALDAALLDAQARDLVESWEDANGVPLDPNFHQPFLNFGAAMEKARRILTAESSHGSLVPSVHLVTTSQQATSDEIIINKEQRDAFLAEIGRGKKLWTEAMSQLRQVSGIQGKINQRLHTLLDGFQKVTASR
jgi:hypothetical protein